jgi:RNA polymerase sigma-70 factor (ECF subfamily)
LASIVRFVGVARVRTKEACGADAHAETEAMHELPRPLRAKPSGAVARDALAHIDSLHHFARYLSGSDTEAEDLVQDTYARALGAASTFVEGTNLRAWLFRICRNAFIDGLRRKRPTVDVEGAAEPASEQAAFAREPLFGDIEMEALRGAVANDIERSLAALSPDARAVVLLDLDGFDEREVAEVVGCAVGTVKSRLARARQTLRHLLVEYRR